MVELISKKISVDAVLEQVADTSAGAVVLFLGRVRDRNGNKAVLSMDYEAYDKMAVTKMEQLEKMACEHWPVSKICIVHRIGSLQLGEVSIAIAVASPHRKDAFAACRFVIDSFKETVPIWKKEYFQDGEGWVEGFKPSLIV